MADEKKIDEIKVDANNKDISSKSNENVNIEDQKGISASGNRKTGKRNILLISAASVVVCAALVCAALFLPALKNTNGKINSDTSTYTNETFGSGATVNGVDISGKTVAEALKALESTEKDIGKKYSGLYLVNGDKKTEITNKDLGITYNTKMVLNDLMKKSLAGNTKLSGEIKALFSFEGVKTKLSQMATEINKDAVDATVVDFDYDSEKFSYKNGEDGKKLNETATLSAFAVFIGSHNSGEVPVTVDTLKAIGAEDDLLSHLGEMASFSTYCTNNYNAAHNMGLAMSNMNHSVIKPGEEFSFHGAVGNSTIAAGGWLQAGAWVGGKLEQQYGGGICQAATTLYNCALYAGLDIVERYCHLQPSSYCDIGLDATVDYGNLDCIVRNNTAYPIYIVSGMYGNTLTMTMYGYKSTDWDDIKLSSQRTGTIPVPDTIYQKDSSLADGQYIRDRAGMSGATATAARSFYKNGVCVKYEALDSSYYSAVAAIYRIGNNTDVSKIPSGSTSGTALAGSSTPSSSEPSSEPSSTPSSEPSSTPSSQPSSTPSSTPSSEPSSTPSSQPSSESSSPSSNISSENP